MVDITQERWQRLTSRDRATLAAGLARELPAGFSFKHIRSCTIGASSHDVAEYDLAGSTFVLVLGGAVRLGYDDERSWRATATELESWRQSADEYGLEESISEHIAATTLRPRTAELEPFLIETSAREVGWETAAEIAPDVNEIIDEHFRNSTERREVVIHRGRGTALRVRRTNSDEFTAEYSRATTHSELAGGLAKTGFRFPTSDEWEFACGAGADTLFRWGDHAPCDRYPTDVSPEEADSRRQWVLSAGKLSRPAAGFRPDWKHHRDANAFGVFIASNPYQLELVAEADMTRGGDGGCMICGGAGFFVGWLTLATAYFEPHACQRDPAEPISPGFTIGRRVLPLR